MLVFNARATVNTYLYHYPIIHEAPPRLLTVKPLIPLNQSYGYLQDIYILRVGKGSFPVALTLVITHNPGDISKVRRAARTLTLPISPRL